MLAYSVALQVDRVEVWFMIRLAMLAGFCAAYPVNWWLLRRGLKEAMSRSKCVPTASPQSIEMGCALV